MKVVERKIVPITDKSKILDMLDKVRADVENDELNGVAIAGAMRTGEALSVITFTSQCNLNVLAGAFWLVTHRMQEYYSIKPDHYDDGTSRPIRG